MDFQEQTTLINQTANRLSEFCDSVLLLCSVSANNRTYFFQSQRGNKFATNRLVRRHTEGVSGCRGLEDDMIQMALEPMRLLFDSVGIFATATHFDRAVPYIGMCGNDMATDELADAFLLGAVPHPPPEGDAEPAYGN